MYYCKQGRDRERTREASMRSIRPRQSNSHVHFLVRDWRMFFSLPLTAGRNFSYHRLATIEWVETSIYLSLIRSLFNRTIHSRPFLRFFVVQHGISSCVYQRERITSAVTRLWLLPVGLKKIRARSLLIFTFVQRPHFFFPFLLSISSLLQPSIESRSAGMYFGLASLPPVSELRNWIIETLREWELNRHRRRATKNFPLHLTGFVSTCSSFTKLITFPLCCATHTARYKS